MIKKYIQFDLHILNNKVKFWGHLWKKKPSLNFLHSLSLSFNIHTHLLCGFVLHSLWLISDAISRFHQTHSWLNTFSFVHTLLCDLFLVYISRVYFSQSNQRKNFNYIIMVNAEGFLTTFAIHSNLQRCHNHPLPLHRQNDTRNAAIFSEKYKTSTIWNLIRITQSSYRYFA